MARFRVAFCSGTRAEYGLLKPLIEQFQKDPSVEAGLFVTGMHLSKEYGGTIDILVKDEMPIWDTVDILLSSNTKTSVLTSMGLALLGFSKALEKSKPDILVLLGDRFETFCAAAAAVVLNIPIAHIHGGEITEGAIDDAFRHAITKMSYLHFASTEEYRKRIIQMGEEPNRVFNVGSLGVENIKKLQLFNRRELQEELNIDLSKPYCVCTFHPETLEPDDTVDHLVHVLEALDEVKSLNIVFTSANADTKGNEFNRIIQEFVQLHQKSSRFVYSLGQLKYFSLLKYAQFVIGNSSSGIIEAPSLNIATINVGNRQRGRIRAASVIDCDPSVSSIHDAINSVLSIGGGLQLNSKNPYDRDSTSENIYKNIIQQLPINSVKHFYDM